VDKNNLGKRSEKKRPKKIYFTLNKTREKINSAYLNATSSGIVGVESWAS